MDTEKTTNSGFVLDLLKNSFQDYLGNRRLLGYVAGVMVAGVVLVISHGLHTDWSSLLTFTFVAWFGINFASEALWLETESGEGTDSMASTMNFAVILLLPASTSFWVITFSVLLATKYLQKRDSVKVAFGLSQMAITVFFATTLFHWIHPGAVTAENLLSVRAITGMVLCAATYFFVNTFLVAGAQALHSGRPVLLTWRQNYGYLNSFISSLALFTLAPTLVVAYLTIGFWGVLLFFSPLLIIKEQNRQYIRMRKMMQERVDREKVYERGMFARKVAHEMNNYIATLSGRLQLMERRAAKTGDDTFKHDIEVLREQIVNLAELARSLMDMTHQGLRPELTDLNRFLVRQIDVNKTHHAFEGVEIVPELDPVVGEVEFDPSLLRQVLLNLMKNSAEAMTDPRSPTAAPVITIRSRSVGRKNICIEIGDNGPGIPKSVQAKIFDPFFSSKKDGHGCGLSTCQFILNSHYGKIWTESDPGDGPGTTFVLEFPRLHPDRKVAEEFAEVSSSPPSKGAEAA